MYNNHFSFISRGYMEYPTKTTHPTAAAKSAIQANNHQQSNKATASSMTHKPPSSSLYLPPPSYIPAQLFPMNGKLYTAEQIAWKQPKTSVRIMLKPSQETAADFVTYSPFDARFGVVTGGVEMKAKKSSKSEFQTFSPWDERFPNIPYNEFTSYSPFDPRFPFSYVGNKRNRKGHHGSKSSQKLVKHNKQGRQRSRKAGSKPAVKPAGRPTPTAQKRRSYYARLPAKVVKAKVVRVQKPVIAKRYGDRLVVSQAAARPIIPGSEFETFSPFDERFPTFVREPVWSNENGLVFPRSHHSVKKHKTHNKRVEKLEQKLREYAKESHRVHVCITLKTLHECRGVPSGLIKPTKSSSSFQSVSPFDSRFPNYFSKSENFADSSQSPKKRTRRSRTVRKLRQCDKFQTYSPWDNRFPFYVDAKQQKVSSSYGNNPFAMGAPVKQAFQPPNSSTMFQWPKNASNSSVTSTASSSSKKSLKKRNNKHEVAASPVAPPTQASFPAFSPLARSMKVNGPPAFSMAPQTVARPAMQTSINKHQPQRA